jgi:hypothetical protein
MKKFGGILAKQLLNYAEELEIRTRLGPIPAQIDSVTRSNSMSSISLSPSFQNQNSVQVEKNEVTRKRAYINWDIHSSNEGSLERMDANTCAGCSSSEDTRDVLKAYCDVEGGSHCVEKFATPYQKTDGRPYTKTRKCSFPECEKKTRVMCCNYSIPLCFPLKNMDKFDHNDVCFLKHVKN